MHELITPDWLMFFTTLTQVSLALASLLFVGFTIYFTNPKRKLAKLEIGVATAYYIEVITAFVLSGWVILPPHDWYFGGGIAVALLNILFYLWIDKDIVNEYRAEHRKVYSKIGWRKIFTKEWREIFTRRKTPDKLKADVDKQKADVYERYKLPCDDRTIFWSRTILLLLSGCVGVAVQLGIVPITVLQVNLAGLALEVFGMLTALYLASCVIGAWLFFFVYYQGDEDSSAPASAETGTAQEVLVQKTTQQAKKEELPLQPPTN